MSHQHISYKQTGLWFKVSSKRHEKWGLKPATYGLVDQSLSSILKEAIYFFKNEFSFLPYQLAEERGSIRCTYRSCFTGRKFKGGGVSIFKGKNMCSRSICFFRCKFGSCFSYWVDSNLERLWHSIKSNRKSQSCIPHINTELQIGGSTEIIQR